MISIKMVSVLATLTGLFLGLLSIIVSVLNRKRFNEICVLYKEKYGSLPDAVLLFENVNTLAVKVAYSMKIHFIYTPLLWNRSSILTKNDDKDFIRGLPKRLIGPFYVEIYLAVISLIFFAVGGGLMVSIEQSWL